MTGLDWMNTPPLPSIRTTAITSPHPTSTRAHPGHEAAWDSPIEDATHPLYDHHSHGFTHHHLSGASTPSSQPADPGFESPWDSPILAAETPASELSESDFEFLKHEALAACFAPHPLRLQSEGEGKAKPVQKAKLEHPPLGSTDGHFATRQLARQRQLGELRDSSSREDFLWCMVGMGGCGR